MKFILLFLSQLFCFLLFAQQDTGCLMLRIFPYEAIVKVDGEQYSKRGRGGYMYLNLKPGKHKIQAWSPTYNLLEKEIEVVEGDTIRYTQSLYFSEDYMAYKKSKRLQTMAKVSLIAIPSLAVIGFTASFYSKKPEEERKVHDAKVAVEMNKIKYENAISINNIRTTKADLNESLNTYDAAVDDYNKFVTNSVIKIGVSAGITAVAIWYVTKFKKIEYSEETLLSRVELRFNPIDGELGFAWKILK